VVRKLIAATDRAIEESPRDYLELAKLAVEVSDSLMSPDYGGDEVLRLRGAAYRERSYSLYLTGDIDGAADWERRARLTFGSVDADFDLARLELLAATVNWRLNRVAEALTACDGAERLFSAAGDFRRVAHALIVKANVLAQSRRFREALNVASRVVSDFDEFLDDHTRAIVRCNEGFYLGELNEPLRSVERLKEAGFIFDAIGARSSSARVELNTAVVLQMSGDLRAAADRLSRVITAFEDLGMYSTAALAAVYLAENRATEGRFDEVERLCTYAMNQAKVSPVAYQERALTALALLREASLQRRVSQKLVRRVRRYLERLPHESRPVLQQAAQDF
jgi:tetratricopeptide (TPR) repeat protein